MQKINGHLSPGVTKTESQTYKITLEEIPAANK